MNKKNLTIVSGCFARPVASVIAIIAIVAQLFFPLASIAATVSVNPALSNSCGIDVALVLDNSTSIDANELSQMKTAFHGFVNSLSVTPTEFSVTNFNTTVAVKQTFTPNVSTVNNSIDTIGTTNNGSTNWEDGLIKAYGTFDPRLSVPNLIIFASDGNPNKYGNGSFSEGPGNGFDQTSLDRAVTEANTIKGLGTRIITLGIGNATGSDALNPDNLKAISSEDAYYNADNFGALSTTLQMMATDLCGGTITATKIVDRDGDINTINDQSAGTGWNMTVAGSAQTTDINGKTESVNVDGSGPFAVSEESQANYSFVSASCTNTNHGNALVGTPGDGQVTGINLTDNDIISCVFYNKPASSTLHVIKNVVNDNPVEMGQGTAVASDFNISVEVAASANAAPFDTITLPGSESGQDYVIPGDSHYFVTESGEQTANYAPSYSGDCLLGVGDMPVNGQQTCTITNNDVQPDVAELTVIKHVINDNGGTAKESDYSFLVTAVTGDDTQNATTTAVLDGQAQTFASGDYKVTESGPAGYAATYSGGCDADGKVTLSAGHSSQCIITNNDIQPKLTVIKLVVGGTKQVSDFPLSVTDSGSDVTPVTSGIATGFNAGIYTVSETQDPNYTPSYSDNCANGQITLQVGQADPTCTITNTYIHPKVKLVVTISANSGDGSGTVTSNESTPVINCHVSSSESCSAEFDLDHTVTLTATPDAGSTFVGTWSGDGCSGDNPTCTINMDGDKTVNAHFALVSTNNNGGSSGSNSPTTPAVSGGGGGSVGGQCMPGYPCSGVKPQVLGASINLDDIAAAIARIRAAIESLAQEIAGMRMPSVLGAATMISTGALDK